jgi:hypothetical protein
VYEDDGLAGERFPKSFQLRYPPYEAILPSLSEPVSKRSLGCGSGLHHGRLSSNRDELSAFAKKL